MSREGIINCKHKKAALATSHSFAVHRREKQFRQWFVFPPECSRLLWGRYEIQSWWSICWFHDCTNRDVSQEMVWSYREKWLIFSRMDVSSVQSHNIVLPYYWPESWNYDSFLFRITAWTSLPADLNTVMTINISKRIHLPQMTGVH